ncbi:hypothetical protein [Arthrobacter sp. Alg241-R88]|uniref:hypothetical protein n=1 Tax=Arthrobacter sp. Alg241-R88 TaxID=2305984 RepID=UPI0013D61110|nr:hypothetical protein [Arthrobacter sp. Alg241-R88]
MSDPGRNDALRDLRDRLARANNTLLDMKHQTERITGKAEGVRLALSYLDDALRTSPGTCWCDGPDCGQIPCVEEVGRA